MNTNEQDHDALLRRLQALPRERMPPADNWRQLQARLAEVPRPVQPRPGLPRRRARAYRRRWPWLLGVAAAACLTLTVGLRTTTVAPESARAAAVPSPLQHQADSMAGAYQQAIAVLPQQTLPAELRSALSELDHSAGAIRTAIAQSPDAGFLLDQLQRTYALRLELTRQGLIAPTGLPT